MIGGVEFQIDSIKGKLSTTTWTRAEDKLFEEALVKFPDDHDPSRWLKIAAHLPSKSPDDIRAHYYALIHDVTEIDAGRIQLPAYPDDCLDHHHHHSSSWDSPRPPHISFDSPTKNKHTDVDRKKGTPWTEEEHRLFLIGLEKYGKGDWRSISRNVVVTRTPTQVASHAQKYYLRQNSGKKERKRSSIHDITTVDDKPIARPVDQNWIPPPNNGPLPQSPQLQPLAHLSAEQEGALGYHNFGYPL